MQRTLIIAALLPAFAQAYLRATPAVQLSAEQKKTMHFGCVDACKPSPVESRCVTHCESEMYRCHDHTGPNEGPPDTQQCQDKVLADTKASAAGNSVFLQIKRNIDDDNARAAEMARLEDQADKEEGEQDESEDNVDHKKNIDEQNADAANVARMEAQADKDEGETSFIQLKNIDDDNARAAEMARLEDQADKEEGEQDESEDNVDHKKNIDEQNADAANVARMEAQADKDEGETSFIQLKKNIDDDNARAAEMARLEDQADKEEGEQDESEDNVDHKKNIDEQNADAANVARMEAQADKDEGESS